jgi:hypothetical protein
MLKRRMQVNSMVRTGSVTAYAAAAAAAAADMGTC